MMFSSIFSPLMMSPARHVYNLLKMPSYRDLCWIGTRYGHLERFIPLNVTAQGYKISSSDKASLISNFSEIFVNEIYRFRFDGSAPRILDLGANIGLSVLYFKKLFPASHITAVEADPKIFGYLNENVTQNKLKDVTLMNKAAWFEDTKLKFHSEGADGGAVQDASDMSVNGIDVDAFDLNCLLKDKSFDFLKMDIEGAELAIFSNLDLYLDTVQYAFVEYHSTADEEQKLELILGELVKKQFRYCLQDVYTPSQPFMDRRMSGFDYQANIFAWRPS